MREIPYNLKEKSAPCRSSITSARQNEAREVVRSARSCDSRSARGSDIRGKRPTLYDTHATDIRAQNGNNCEKYENKSNVAPIARHSVTITALNSSIESGDNRSIESTRAPGVRT